MRNTEIKLSEYVSVCLGQDASGCWNGISQVRVGKHDLIAPGKKWTCEIRTPEGLELCRYVLEGQRQQGESLILTLRPHARQTRLMEWMIHASRQRLNLKDTDGDPTPLPGTIVELELSPIKRQLGTCVAHGLRYQWRFASGNVRIYQIMERSAWAPEGTVRNCQIRQRNCFVDSQETIDGEESHWATEWHLPDCGNSNTFQFIPFQTELDGFTFLSGSNGTLLPWEVSLHDIARLSQTNFPSIY